MATRERVLIVEDDPALKDILEQAVVAEGYEMQSASSAAAARALDGRPFDLVLSDIDLPDNDRTELLKAIRARDLDVPIVMITDGPHMQTAFAALEYGATHYLTKPVDVPRLHEVMRRALRARWFAQARRRLVELAGDSALQVSDLAGLGERFDRALSKAYMLCQPIVQWSNQSTFAYEALVRSSEPTIAHPGALFDAADRLDRTLEIGRRVRALCGEYVGRPPDALLFVNVHTKDLMDNVIYSPDTALARMANHVVLEITERARLEVIPDAPGRIARLRSMGFRIAIDDLGAGYAGLTSFASLEPNFMKLDRSLVEGIHQSNTKMKLVGAMINACRELGVQVVGEGIETVAERDALISLGCDLLQGYLFARPEPPFTTPRF